MDKKNGFFSLLNFALVFSFLIATGTTSFGDHDPNVVHACVGKITGGIRVVSNPSKCITKIENPIQLQKPVLDSLQMQIDFLSNQINNLSDQVNQVNKILDIISSTPKTVFVTSLGSLGDLGGIEGADQTCHQLAESAGLPGLYRAWLSDSSTSPAQRFIQNKAQYMLVNGTKIADDWNDLTDGTLDAPINRDENNNVVSQFVWTNTNANGTLNGPLSCMDWTSTGDLGGFGNSAQTDGMWTLAGFGNCGVINARLYCFQQF